MFGSWEGGGENDHEARQTKGQVVVQKCGGWLSVLRGREKPLAVRKTRKKKN